jgi:hypothetical protein
MISIEVRTYPKSPVANWWFCVWHPFEGIHIPATHNSHEVPLEASNLRKNNGVYLIRISTCEMWKGRRIRTVKITVESVTKQVDEECHPHNSHDFAILTKKAFLSTLQINIFITYCCAVHKV